MTLGLEETRFRWRFFVPGAPASTNKLYRTNRFGGVWKTKEAQGWAEAVGWGAKGAGVKLSLSPDIRLSILYCHPGKRRCDLDNILKVTLDGLNGVAWKDDKQVSELFVQAMEVEGDQHPGLLLTLRVGHNGDE